MENWWEKPINFRIKYINAKYGQLIMNISRRIIYVYPPVPIEATDLFNMLLYKIAIEFEKYKQEVPENIYLARRANCMGKNICKHYLTQKYKVLNKSILLEEDAGMWVADVRETPTEYSIDDFSDIEKKVFTQMYVYNKTKKWIMDRYNISRRKMDKIVIGMKTKIKTI